MRWTAGLIVVCMSFLLAAGPATNPVKQRLDGRELPNHERYPAQSAVLRFAPDAAVNDQAGRLVIEDLEITHITNQTAIDVTTWAAVGNTVNGRMELREFPLRELIVRRCRISNVKRDEVGQKLERRVHAVSVWGTGVQEKTDTDVLLEDVTVSDCDGLPVLLKEGRFGAVTLRRVKVTDSVGPAVQIIAMNGGSVKRLVIEDCPGLKVDLIGSRGSIGSCTVRASEGAEVRDVDGKTGVNVVTVKAAAGPPRGGTKLTLVAGTRGKSVVLKLEDVGADVASVTFEAFDPHGYRMGLPVVVTEAPWGAEIAVNRPGKVAGRASITRSGGDVEKAMEGTVQVGGK
jgi:hypothetical protein